MLFPFIIKTALIPIAITFDLLIPLSSLFIRIVIHAKKNNKEPPC